MMIPFMYRETMKKPGNLLRKMDILKNAIVMESGFEK